VTPNNNQYTGQPECPNGKVWDFNNNRVFDSARLRRQRIIIGANVRYEVLMFGAQLITDLVPPYDAQPNSDKAAKVAMVGENRQYTGVFEFGGMF
jgi:hypothetical protein